MNDELIYKLAFASLRGINRLMAGELLSRVGSEEQFFRASEGALSAMMGGANRLFARDYRDALLEKAKAEADFVVSSGIRTVYYRDSGYPERLAHCDDAPLMLYTLGNVDLNAGHWMSVVGTRHATPYGLGFVDKLISTIAETVSQPVTIVSGLAFGIDIAAHKAAMKYGLSTVGVLAHGLNTIYPAQHRSVAADMVRSDGMLVTEYMSSAPIHKGNFVARNRIVAGLCDCLVVAESAGKGGALITATLASDYCRDVFALPGRVSDRFSEGCNRLIASNVASLVQDPMQVIEAMGWPTKESDITPKQQTLFEDLSEDERAVLDYLTERGEAMVNQMSVNLNINVGKLMSLLINMEFKGLVMNFPGGKYRLA